MKELVIASNNPGKIKELTAMLPDFLLFTLSDIGFSREIPEPYETFEENAAIKASTIHAFCGKNVFADDSGICVDALNGAPGVHSAYFGGQPRDDGKNLLKLLQLLEGNPDRSAHYKAVICLMWEGSIRYFEGICRGHILEAPRGKGGFGYDPVFVPEGFDESFGEMAPEMKNKISHRGKAIAAMMAFLKEQNGA